jgi:hypothetical protein
MNFVYKWEVKCLLPVIQGKDYHLSEYQDE